MTTEEQEVMVDGIVKMGVQSSEMIDSKLIIVVHTVCMCCPSSLLAAARIWALSDEKNCTTTYAQHTNAVHELLAR